MNFATGLNRLFLVNKTFLKPSFQKMYIKILIHEFLNKDFQAL